MILNVLEVDTVSFRRDRAHSVDSVIVSGAGIRLAVGKDVNLPPRVLEAQVTTRDYRNRVFAIVHTRKIVDLLQQQRID